MHYIGMKLRFPTSSDSWRNTAEPTRPSRKKSITGAIPLANPNSIGLSWGWKMENSLLIQSWWTGLVKKLRQWAARRAQTLKTQLLKKQRQRRVRVRKWRRRINRLVRRLSPNLEKQSPQTLRKRATWTDVIGPGNELLQFRSRLLRSLAKSVQTSSFPKQMSKDQSMSSRQNASSPSVRRKETRRS